MGVDTASFPVADAWADRSRRPPSRPPRRSLIRLAVGGFDVVLRWAQHVVDIDRRAPCLLRMARTHAPRLICIDGRIVAEPGDPVVAVHFRNEDLPPAPAGGPDIAWVCRFRDELRHAMRRLAARMESDPALADVTALYALMALASIDRGAKARRFGAWFGFRPADTACPASLGRQLHDRLEDVWLWAMAWAYNPVCLRRRRLLRSRDEVWISRADFLRRYGTAANVAAE